MPIDLKELSRKTREDVMSSLTPEEKEKFLRSLPLKDRLAGMTPEEQLKALSPEALEVLRRQLKAEQTTPEAK